ncbi:MAG: DUF2279 domain-containing protein [Ignavibacteriaceae bacterium]|nr:YfiM family protein [Ignavibacteria bacterium]MBT8390765.1 YfiM family protein [Ignavibacteria bacterium]NNJ53651.1 DUF2279 domain-containing protein [Ignavibacteriaceae bacterium]NNL22351.1 DUF2279 domain-containing protein [Ignavibacteriaceae bacterium]
MINKKINIVILFLLMSTLNFAQNSYHSNKFSPKFFYYDKADDHLTLNSLSNYSPIDQSQFQYPFNVAQKPTFVNSELSLNDGTYWRKNSDINFLKLSSILGAMATVDLVAYMAQREIWYKEETTVFHTLDFVNDWNKFQQMDKIGHFTDAYFTSDLAGKLYRWAGFSGNTSVWLGALSGWIWTLQIEISDAFMAEWGFSWGDMLANTLGSGFYLLQQFNYDLLGGIHPKFSWHKSDAWKEDRYYRDPQGLIEDYEGMTFWITVNPHHYFPESWKDSYPEWLAPLGIAFGHGAKNIASNPWGGHKEIFVGLDVDIRKIPIGDDWDFFKFLKSELNFIRLPLPTVRFSKSGTWFGFYF